MDIPKLEGIEDLFKGKGWHLLLASQLLFFFLLPLAQEQRVWLFAPVEIAFWVVFGILALRCKNGWAMRSLITLMILGALSTGIVCGFIPDSASLAIFHRVVSLFSTLLVSGILLKHLFLAETASWGTISCSLCAYMALATAWANAYMLALCLDPRSLSHLIGSDMRPFLSGTIDSMSEIFYFSLTTITTVGLGDVLPANRWTRMMCGMEAVMGQFYMAVVIARIVALHLTDRSREGK